MGMGKYSIYNAINNIIITMYYVITWWVLETVRHFIKYMII